MQAKHRALLHLAAFTRKHPFRGLDRLLRMVHNPDARHGDFVEAIVNYDGRGRIHVRTSSFIEWTIFFKGLYEPELVAFIDDHVTRDSIVVDVGANIGAHTIALSRAAQVIAVEPNPAVVDRLRENIRLSGLDNVELFEVALAAQPGEQTLFVPDPSAANQGVATLHPTGDVRRTGITVPVRTLDDITAAVARLDFVKIDAEGHDFDVLMGGRRALERHRPVVVFEWEERTWKAAGHRLEEAHAFLEGLGYRLSLLTASYVWERRLHPLRELRDFGLLVAQGG